MQGDSSTPGPCNDRTEPRRKGDGRGAQRRCRGISVRGRTARPVPTCVLAGSRTPLAHCVRPSPLKGGRNRLSSPSSLWSLGSPFQGGRQRSAATMQGDSSTPGPCNDRTEPRRKGDGRGAQRRCRGIPVRGRTARPVPTCVLAGSRTPLAHCVRPSPLKGGRNRLSSPSSLWSLGSPFQGGRQRSAATMRGDSWRKIPAGSLPTHVLAGSRTPLAHFVRPSPLKGGRNRLSSPSSPFQGGRQRSGATMRGDCYPNTDGWCCYLGLRLPARTSSMPGKGMPRRCSARVLSRRRSRGIVSEMSAARTGSMRPRSSMFQWAKSLRA